MARRRDRRPGPGRLCDDGAAESQYGLYPGHHGGSCHDVPPAELRDRWTDWNRTAPDNDHTGLVSVYVKPS